MNTLAIEPAESNVQALKEKLHRRSVDMMTHPVFKAVHNMASLQRFMEWHVFAVWDFMSLVKRLQHEFTSLTLPWTPPARPAAARLLNEIVLGEESDDLITGEHASHFDIYLAAMREVDADTSQIEQFVDLIKGNIPLESALARVNAPEAIITFVKSTIETAKEGSVTDALGSFLYGREDAIPQMFKTLLAEWSIRASDTPTFVYYLQRHIELDADSHGPAAEQLANDVVQGDEGALCNLYEAGIAAVEQRIALWDELQRELIAFSKV